MQCEAALEYGVGPIGVSSLNPSFLTVLFDPANYTIMFYDFFLTMGLETELVWSSKWSLAKALYLSTTYFNLSNMIIFAPGFITQCTRNPKTLATLVPWLGLIIICTAEFVLIFRTWVLWERKKNIGMGLLGLFGFLAIPSMTFIVIGMQQQDVAGSQPILSSIPFFSFVLLAFYESVMLGLIAYRAKQHFASAQDLYIPLNVVLFRDGILYYIFLLSISLTVTGFLVAENLPIVMNISAMHVTLHSVLTKRMFLNLRNVASEDSSESWVPNSTFMAVSGLQFASRSDANISCSSNFHPIFSEINRQGEDRNGETSLRFNTHIEEDRNLSMV
ncbi:hypothetical protein K439DRAFT_1657481 [Ramaria rubella]|nr:hypothetical protein K439DRAFT_1657481 [Ramaria rubella]